MKPRIAPKEQNRTARSLQSEWRFGLEDCAHEGIRRQTHFLRCAIFYLNARSSNRSRARTGLSISLERPAERARPHIKKFRLRGLGDWGFRIVIDDGGPFLLSGRVDGDRPAAAKAAQFDVQAERRIDVIVVIRSIAEKPPLALADFSRPSWSRHRLPMASSCLSVDPVPSTRPYAPAGDVDPSQCAAVPFAQFRTLRVTASASGTKIAPSKRRKMWMGGVSPAWAIRVGIAPDGTSVEGSCQALSCSLPVFRFAAILLGRNSRGWRLKTGTRSGQGFSGFPIRHRWRWPLKNRPGRTPCSSRGQMSSKTLCPTRSYVRPDRP